MDKTNELNEYAQKIELWMRQKNINLIDAHGDQANFQYDWISGDGQDYRSVIVEKLPQQKPNDIMAEDFSLSGNGLSEVSMRHDVCGEYIYSGFLNLKQINQVAVNHRNDCSAIER